MPPARQQPLTVPATYSFTGLANGSYTVTPSLMRVRVHAGEPGSHRNGASVTAVNFTSALQTYSITGTISGPGGAGATVNLTGASTATTTADGSGNYSFTGLANGSYTVTPTNGGYIFTPASQAVTLSGGNAAANFTSALLTYSISGTISGAGGAGATVSLTGASTADNHRGRLGQLQLQRAAERLLYGDTDQHRVRIHTTQPDCGR